MNPPVAAGIGLTLLAGLLSGNCMLPSKFVKRWRWENIWFVFSIASLLILPWLLAITLVRHLPAIYAGLPAKSFLAPLCFGAGWGIAQVLFGISVRRLGMGVAYAIIVGLGAALGTVVPLFFLRGDTVASTTVVKIIAGVAIMLAGIALSAIGGKMREQSAEQNSTAENSGNYGSAVFVAVLCGVLAPMLNYAFAFGQELADAAVRMGNSSVHAAYAVWPIALLGGFFPNILYSLILIKRERSWGQFSSYPDDLGWPTLMAILWMGAFAIYGMSSVLLGRLGTSVGWGLFQIFMILTATLSGFATAEWKHAPRRSLLLQGSGVACLLLATFLLSAVNR